jgi:hypothetical protein
MYRKVNYKKSTVTSVKVFEGERIEKRVERIINNAEPITDGAPIVYTERGTIDPNYNHRTDLWEIATDNMSVVHRSETVKKTGVALPKGEENPGESDNVSTGE